MKSSHNAFKIFCQLYDLNYLNIKPATECSPRERVHTNSTSSYTNKPENNLDNKDKNSLEESIDYCYTFESDINEKSESEFCEKWDDFIICFLD